jgi:hypothetical protein
MSLIAHLIVRLVYGHVVPMFCQFLKRYPLAAVSFAVVGQVFGGWLAWECILRGNWAMTGLGILMCIGYSALAFLVAVKWWNGTWAKSCDYVLSLVE